MLMPAPAYAAVPPDPNAVLVAGPAPKIFQGEADKRIWETMEVRNDSDKPLRVVLYVKTEGLWFAGAYHTCRYTDNLPPDLIPASGEQAICEPPNEIEPGGSYKLGGEMIRVHPKAVPGAQYSYTFTWYTKEYADAQGPTWLDRDKMTPGFKGLPLMTKVTPETPYSGTNSSSGRVVIAGGTTPPTTPTTTVKPTITIPTDPDPDAEPTDDPTSGSPVTPSASTTPPTTPAAPETSPVAGGVGGGDTGGDLPLTGTNVAVIGGLGGVLLLGGGVAFFLARRRRTAFTA
ncbi:LPXTG cell wall anchor domain-containing protein [Actinoplanes sp. LDG1-06]|uniref:LPXTG cell wall anchor domain-containing protein n=2 Tax=Paractinoplanes ovalisporus TaxID=2810368 RepID=A0ABS2A4J4_9ACTN|nr:LPXTG cell wall anchor domain-containing protein [Actinoplanes ovalisporus]